MSLKSPLLRTVVLLAGVLAAAACGDPAPGPPDGEGPLRIGRAIADITPDLDRYGELHPLGYLLNPPVRGVKDPLLARVLVLDNGHHRAAWVTLDTCLVDRYFCDRVAAGIRDIVARNHLFVSATHTHGGIAHVLEQPIYQVLYGVEKPELRDELAARIAGAVRRAAAGMRPARLAFGARELEDMNQNRRPYYGVSLADLGTDREMTVLAFTGPAGSPLAILGNFAAHPTLAPTFEDPQYTADFVGVYNETVERRYGDGLTFAEGGPVLSVFTNGVLGDAEPYYPNPLDREIQSWQKSAAYGRKLATAASPIIDDALAARGSARVPLRTRTVALPLPTVVPSTAPMQALLFFVPVIHYDLSMTTLRLGDVLVNFFIGEPTTPVGLHGIKEVLKTRSGLHAIVAAPSNDYIGYVPSAFQYAESESVSNYERMVCMFGPLTEVVMVDTALASAVGLY